MADKHTPEQRKHNMSSVKAINTKPEVIVAKYLYRYGYRYRKHYKIQGTPDIVFPNKKIAIFVHGCFWHQHTCKKAKLPHTNHTFWENKLLGNKKRDMLISSALKIAGWKVIVVWECTVMDKISLSKKMNSIMRKLAKAG